LQKSSELAVLQEPSKLKIKNHQATIKMQLPRQAVSLIKLTY
jgi:xylan 1,4-beta-xylosidase